MAFNQVKPKHMGYGYGLGHMQSLTGRRMSDTPMMELADQIRTTNRKAVNMSWRKASGGLIETPAVRKHGVVAKRDKKKSATVKIQTNVTNLKSNSTQSSATAMEEGELEELQDDDFLDIEVDDSEFPEEELLESKVQIQHVKPQAKGPQQQMFGDNELFVLLCDTCNQATLHSITHHGNSNCERCKKGSRMVQPEVLTGFLHERRALVRKQKKSDRKGRKHAK